MIPQQFDKLKEKLKNHLSSSLRAEYLIRIEKYEADSPEIKKLRESACNEEPLSSILKNRDKEGWWFSPAPTGVYKKYQGTVWTLLFSAELGAPTEHYDFRDSCSYFMDKCYVKRTGCFSLHTTSSHIFPCFTAHACYFLTYFGFFDDERVQNAFKWLADNLGIDGGMNCYGMDSMLNPTCVMAIPKLLKAASLLTKPQRKKHLGNSLDRAIKKLMDVNLDSYQPVEATEWYKAIRGKRGKGIAEVREMKKRWKLSGKYKKKQNWSKFQFPLHYDSDLLEVLLYLGRLGVKENDVLKDGARRVYDLVGKDGQWHHGRSLKGKMWADLTTEDDWISLRAIEVLQNYR